MENSTLIPDTPMELLTTSKHEPKYNTEPHKTSEDITDELLLLCKIIPMHLTYFLQKKFGPVKTVKLLLCHELRHSDLAAKHD